MLLKGKVAVITGGTRGLGRQIAAAFLAEGSQVVIAGRDPAPARELLDEYGDAVAFQETDVRRVDSVAELMAQAVSRFGGLDIVVANAGISNPGQAAAIDPRKWSETLDTNVNGVFHCTHAAVPHLVQRGGGKIINLSSALATRITPGASAYCASKAAVEMFTRVTAVELAPQGITANCLSPGLIDEGMGKALAANEPVWARYKPKLAMGRLGRPDEVVGAALFLAGPDSSYVNGHVLEVNGGLQW
ncbi:SDR family NAD(P)-dependent oxidoreductase [Catellatospora tritici]|uniref:SDR family NAD(P)-dependent oxidoreductase n=1 Tax=Catellatospora tritici TaxID=2851566 RepID=UPI001C2D3A14|nr:SDR family NAD(P)-dependent oxidoreductase [Catellatospora tritici]MBV1855588.1 SDR family oxidoreductase [Catellatospora tritici]